MRLEEKNRVWAAGSGFLTPQFRLNCGLIQAELLFNLALAEKRNSLN